VFSFQVHHPSAPGIPRWHPIPETRQYSQTRNPRIHSLLRRLPEHLSTLQNTTSQNSTATCPLVIQTRPNHIPCVSLLATYAHVVSDQTSRRTTLGTDNVPPGGGRERSQSTARAQPNIQHIKRDKFGFRLHSTERFRRCCPRCADCQEGQKVSWPPSVSSLARLINAGDRVP
jgi:hypothetical protein